MKRIGDYDLNDFKKAFDLVMNKEHNDAIKGILYVDSFMIEDKFKALIVKDQCDLHYYVVDKGNGIEIFDYDKDSKEIGEEAYIAIPSDNNRTLIADAIKKFYYDYLEAIKK